MRFSSSELSSHLLDFSVSFIAKNWRKYPYGSKRVKISVLNFLAKICGAILQLLGRENSPGEKNLLFLKLTRILVSKNSGWVVSKSENTVWLFNCWKNPQGPVACLWKQKSSDNLTIFLSLRNEKWLAKYIDLFFLDYYNCWKS